MTKPVGQTYRPRVPRAAPWTLADVIDFEHLLAAEGAGRPEADRQLFQEKIAPTLPPEALARRPAVFRAWLEARRAEAAKPTPGECFTAGWQTLLLLALAVGLLIGGSVAGALLAYPDPEPINAPFFFTCTAGLQIVVLLAGLLAWVARHWLGSVFGGLAPVRALLGALLAAFGSGLRRLPGEQRNRVREALSIFDRRRDIYGSLAAWPLLLVTQLFAAAFNVGILGTMLVIHLPLVEMRFGWQSTYQLSDEQMHRTVATLAAPWKWATPHAHPTLPEIRESRYSHGQSAQSLPPDAARAWWPFLACAVAVYGLLPRIALLAFSAGALSRGLSAQRFEHAEANALWRRLTGPAITVRGGEATLSDEPAPAAPERPAAPAATGECLALVAKELAVEDSALRAELLRHYGWQVRAVRAAQIDSRRESAALLAELRAASPSLAGVAVIAPAERDPIMAVALFLREVEAAAGAKPEVVMLLTGTSGDGGNFAPVDDERFGIWQRFRNIQKLRAGIERWPAL